MIKITNENIEIYRNYYKTLYSIRFNDNGNYTPELKEAIERWIDKRLSNCLNQDKDLDMSNYITGLLGSTRIEPLSIEEKVELARINPYYKVSLIRYYQNNMELKIRLMDIEESKKEELIAKSDEKLQNAIMHYFDARLTAGLHNYISNTVLKKFNVQNDIISNDVQSNAIIKARNGDKKSRESLYRRYIEEFSKVKITNLLTKKEQKKYVEYHVKRVIDSYLDNNSVSELGSYISNSFEKRLLSNEDEASLLVRYSMIFDDKYDETIEFLLKKCRSIPYEVLKRMKLTNNKRLLAQLSYELKDYIVEYLDFIKKEQKYTSYETYIKVRMKSCIKNMNDYDFEFDLEKARYGSIEDKEEQLEILKEISNELKESYKRKNIYYTDEKNVDARIEKCFNRACERYINNNSQKQGKSYVSTVLGQDMSAYSRITSRAFFNKKEDQKLILRISYRIASYVKLNNLNEEEAKLFNDYVLFRVNCYINNGCFTESIDSLLYKIIKEYDVNKEKEYNESISKVKIVKPPFKK